MKKPNKRFLGRWGRTDASPSKTDRGSRRSWVTAGGAVLVCLGLVAVVLSPPVTARPGRDAGKPEFCLNDKLLPYRRAARIAAGKDAPVCGFGLDTAVRGLEVFGALQTANGKGIALYQTREDAVTALHRVGDALQKAGYRPRIPESEWKGSSATLRMFTNGTVDTDVFTHRVGDTTYVFVVRDTLLEEMR